MDAASQRRKLPRLAWILVAAVGGFSLGRYFFPSAAVPAPSAEPASFYATDPESVRRLHLEIVRLRDENAALKQSRPAPLPATAALPPEKNATPPLAALKTLLEVKDQKFANIRLPAVLNDGRLAPGFVQLFALTPAESDTLVGVLSDAHRRMGEMSIAHATATTTADAIVITVEPFPDGSDIYEGMMTGFRNTLGPERYEAMMALHTDEFDRAFSFFGAAVRTVTVRRASQELPGSKEVELRLDDHRKTAKGNSGTGSAFTSSTIPENYAWIAPLIRTAPALPPAAKPVRGL